MNALNITQAERYIWQRQAAMALVRLLDKHRDLPSIVWTVGTGSNLMGRINGLQPAATARAVFDAWAAALKLDERPEDAQLGLTYRRARARRDSVNIALVADLILDEAEEASR